MVRQAVNQSESQWFGSVPSVNVSKYPCARYRTPSSLRCIHQNVSVCER